MSRARSLYEVLITEAIETDLRALDERLKAHHAVAGGRAADRIATLAIAACRCCLGRRAASPSGLPSRERSWRDRPGHRKVDAIPIPIEPGGVRAGCAPTRQAPESIDEPLIPLDTALLTNAPGEPRVAASTEIPRRSHRRRDGVHSP
jgi:hypothetical protein